MTEIPKKTKKHILDAAKKEFAEKGFNGSRMSSIAKRAGANQALIHYYFSSKENLYTEVLLNLLKIEESTLINEFMDQWDLTPPEALYAAIFALVKMNIGTFDSDLNKILAIEIFEGQAHYKAIVNKFFNPRIIMLEDIIKKGIESGDFETKEPLLIIFGLISLVLAFETNKDRMTENDIFFRLYGEHEAEKILEFAIDHTFKGLCPAGKSIKIPVMDSKFLSSLDLLISKIKNIK